MSNAGRISFSPNNQQGATPLVTVIQQLLEAHVQHELAKFQSKKLQHSIREEVAAVFEWAKRLKLGEIISVEQITDLIGRNVVAMPLPPGVTELMTSMSQRVRTARINKSTSIKDICPRPAYDAAVAKIGSMEGFRHALIHRLVTSSIYTNQISSALYTGIKEYLLTENVLAQKVPGLASLIKLGTFAVNKTMKPLEAVVEKTVKAYIEANLGNTIRRSEKSINEHFDQAHIVEFGERLWKSSAASRLSAYTQLVDGKDMADAVAIGRDFWLHFRTTPYFKAVYTDLVQSIFERYADLPLSALAADFGVTEKIVIRELSLTLSTAAESAVSRGFLEQRIRARLESFYLSDQAAAVIAAAMRPGHPPQVKASTTAVVSAPAIVESKSAPRKARAKMAVATSARKKLD